MYPSFTMQPWRRGSVWLGVAAVMLLLTGCPLGYPPPVDVPFPDDPRVLDGSWEMVATGLSEGLAVFHLDANATNLVIWSNANKPRAFRSDGAGAYVETDASSFAGLVEPVYDAALEALVSLEPGGGSATVTETVTVAPLDGSPTVTQVLKVPAGATLVDAFAGSGRTFLLLRTPGEPLALRWFDSLSGADEGGLSVGTFRDGLRATPSRRALLGWDLDAWKVRVIATADPEHPRSVSLGACRSNTFGELSPDGRWFVFADCVGNLLAVDLSDDAGRRKPLGLNVDDRVAFASDGSDLVWVADRLVRALDLATGRSRTLHELSAAEAQHLTFPNANWWDPLPYLNRPADLLALPTRNGRLALIDLAADRELATLPPLPFERGTMDLTATKDPAGALSYFDPEYGYAFHGTLTIDAVGYDVKGVANAYRLHRYVPTGSELDPSALPPPAVRGWGKAFVPGATDPSFNFNFRGGDALSARYEGELLPVDGSPGVTVVLRRP